MPRDGRPAARRIPAQTSSMKTWIDGEKPREIILAGGTRGMATAKLLAVILRTGRKGKSAEELARCLLNSFRALRRIDAAEVCDLLEFRGIGPAKVAQIKAAFELGRRLVRERAQMPARIQSARQAAHYVYSYYGPYLRDAHEEVVCLVLLDRKNRPVANMEIGRGGPETSALCLRAILRQAILRSASSLILVHNHPSGDGSPSADDRVATGAVRKACGLLGIRLLDHIIIGRNRDNCYSFALRGPTRARTAPGPLQSKEES